MGNCNSVNHSKRIQQQLNNRTEQQQQHKSIKHNNNNNINYTNNNNYNSKSSNNNNNTHQLSVNNTLPNPTSSSSSLTTNNNANTTSSKPQTTPKPKSIKTKQITITASLRETDSYLCVNAGDTIEIHQHPNSTWCFIDKEQVTYEGYTNTKYITIPIGALMMRVSSTRTAIHINHSPFTYTFTHSGSLLFFAHLDEDLLHLYKPSNELIIDVTGNFGFVSPKYPFNELDTFIPLEVNTRYMEMEYLINRVRVNPKKFFIERVLNAMYVNKETLTDIDNLYAFAKELRSVTNSNELNDIAQEHADELEKSSLNGKLKPNEQHVKQRYPHIEYRCVVICECDNAFDIVVEMLNKKDNRDNILNQRYNLFGMGYQKHLIYQLITVVLFGVVNN